MEEPSLLDYLKSKLSLRSLLKSRSTERTAPVMEQVEESDPARKKVFMTRLPGRLILVIALALLGQRAFEPPNSQLIMGIIFYFISLCLLIYTLWKNEWVTPGSPEEAETSHQPGINRLPFYALLPMSALSFFTFSNNQFTSLNVVLWIATFAAALAAFWQRSTASGWDHLKERIVGFLHKPELRIRFSWWGLLVVSVFCLAAFFHLYRLNSVPLEMTSDHAEKLLDVQDVLDGTHPIFFSRNAGREPIQFYLTAFLIKTFGMPIGFTTLKAGMALAFLLSLFYMYRLGKEVGNRWTGLFAMLLLGIASWTNILARVGMRLVLTPVFLAPVLFYLFRGFRQHKRNDLILAGIFLGLGLMGYSAFRIVPVAVVLIGFVFLFHRKVRTIYPNLLSDFGILVVFALVAALPLLRFAIQYPDIIGMRTLTRITDVEQAINGPVFLVFLQNFWNAITMPFWRDGNTWVISVTGRPALDLVSAAFYLLGVVILTFTWLRYRVWQYLALLISIPVLMLPSIMALAFPIENPSLSRAGGAVIPIALICAIALETLVSSFWVKAQTMAGRVMVVLLAGGLVLISARQNFELVFTQYNNQYVNATWNTSQMGKIARDYIDSIGSPETVYVVAKAHWVDTRLVAMNTGFIRKDYQIWPQDLNLTLTEQRSKLFFVKADDQEGMEALQKLYPDGATQLYTAAAPGRDFYTYFVPPQPAGQ